MARVMNIWTRQCDPSRFVTAVSRPVADVVTAAVTLSRLASRQPSHNHDSHHGSCRVITATPCCSRNHATRLISSPHIAATPAWITQTAVTWLLVTGSRRHGATASRSRAAVTELVTRAAPRVLQMDTGHALMSNDGNALPRTLPLASSRVTFASLALDPHRRTSALTLSCPPDVNPTLLSSPATCRRSRDDSSLYPSTAWADGTAQQHVVCRPEDTNHD